MLFIYLIIIFIILFYLTSAYVGNYCFIHKFYVKKLNQLFEYSQRDFNNKSPSSPSQTTKQPTSEKWLFNKKFLNREKSLDSDYNTDVSNDSAIHSSESDSDFEEKSELFTPLSINHSMSLKLNQNQNELDLSMVIEFASVGLQAIVDDVVTKRFVSQELQTWNLLTRTNKLGAKKSFPLTCIWLAGILFRYMALPIKMIAFIIWIIGLILIAPLLGILPEKAVKQKIYPFASMLAIRVKAAILSMVIAFHNKENKPKPGGICVANHTSPIDFVVLHCDNSYALVGQRHGGILGLIQRFMSKTTQHLWFNRFEFEDRQTISQRLREHTEDSKNLPILVFPEGTCINNSAVMMFKKGSFEIGATIYPVAIKYDARFGDPFWNSSKYGYFRYLLMMMTSWAIVCDVWYLPPMTRRPDESAIEFANRVKSKIASRGGMVDLEWDGQLKRMPVKPELVKQQQFEFSQTIKKHFKGYL